MSLAETMVRMGDLEVSSAGADTLVSIGLGSCIGLALLDRAVGVAGLAHVMLPVAPATGTGGQPGKFADTAVPELIDRVVAAGARRARIEATLVGGAQMFSFGGGSMDIGARNAAAVAEALAASRIPVRAAATGGSKGRTVRVDVGAGTVRYKEAGGAEVPLLSPGAGSR